MRIELILSGLLTLLMTASSSAQDRARVELPSTRGLVTIEAFRLAKESAELWVAEDQVVIRFQNTTIKSAKVVYNPLTEEAVFESEVELIDGTQWLKGARAELNLKSDTGVLYEVEGFTDRDLFIKAKRLVKTGAGTYVASDGFITACEEAVPKWSFKLKKASIRLESSARIKHTLFRIKKIPVFYLPYVVVPTEKKKRSSGFMIPSTGSSNNKGRRLSQAFYVVMGESADLTLHQDYFSERGFGHGFEFRTRPNSSTTLQLDGYLLDDKKGQGGASLDALGETRFANGFRGVADFSLVSNFLFRQVFSDNFFTATQPTEVSRVFLTNNFQSRSINVLLSREETLFPGRNTVIRSFPTFQFKLHGHRFDRLPFYLDLDTTAGGFSRTDSLIETPSLTQRFDFFPQMYLSLPLFQGLRVTPRVALRETFYSDSLTSVESGQTAETSGDDLARHYVELTLDLKGWGLSRIYGASSPTGSWKHLIEPAVRYQYRSGIDEFDRILRFDEYDTITNSHEVEYGIFNRIFVKRGSGDRRQTQEWMSIKVTQKHFFDPDFGGAFEANSVNQFSSFTSLTGFHFGGIRRNFSPITTVARVTPRPGFSFDARTDYDSDFHRLRNVGVAGYFSRDQLLFGAAYFRTRELESGSFESNQIQSHIAIGRLRRGVSVSGSLSYDAETSRFLNYRSRLNYFWECCGVSVDFQGFNLGARQESQIRFAFFLKGIGSLGTIRRPRSPF